MQTKNGSILFSPTDLIRFMESPFASWMQLYYLLDPTFATPDPLTEDAKLIAKTGDQHEARFLQKLIDEGRDIVSIPKSNMDAALVETRQAIADGREVIYQGALAMKHFAGYTDFIVRGENGDYEIWDTKLARQTKPYHLVQLCCYAEMLEPLVGHLPETIRVVLGDLKVVSYRTADFFHSYRNIKKEFLIQINSFMPEAQLPPPDPRANHRQRTSHADAWLLERDHLVQVAGINTRQMDKLVAAGIDTMQKLADSALTSVSKLKAESFAKIQSQARIQVKARSLPEGSPPPFEVLHPAASAPRTGLALLPPASPGDVYFDIEGYPLENDGLEYLLGVTHLVDGKPEFKDWWAHNDAEEKQSFEAFIDWITACWQQYPDMHVYHYAPYEVTAIKRLVGKYATREAEVDSLLRHGVLVDLYRIVRQGLLIGAPSYSLKKVERLYLDARDGEVQNAAASIVYYAEWQESGESAAWQESPILKKIRDYNQVDCESTWLLAQWLRDQQQLSSISYLPDPGSSAAGVSTYEISEATQKRMALAQRILDHLPPEGDERRPIAELIGHLIEFHRRDDKPMWWSRFERAGMTEDDLADDFGCLAGLTLVGQPVPDKSSRIATYHFDPSQETKISQGSKVILTHCPNANMTVTSLDSHRGIIELKLGTASLNAKLGGSFPPRISLLPDEYLSAEPIEQALFDLAGAWEKTGDIPSCLKRLILRQGPDLHGLPQDIPFTDLPRDNSLETLSQVVPAMRGSTLVIQGPPGTGKTYTASRLIKDLITAGKRVGITSNSHKAIINLLSSVHQAGGNLSGSVYATSLKDRALDALPDVKKVQSKDALDAYQQGVIAGTPWLFSRPEWVDQLDYLFIDEAGQVSLANVAAMSRATDNLILLGDQNQLAMPSQGAHPGESGSSALVYLLQNHAVVPPELGVFLGTTYRLHPDICRFISDAFYDGQLQPDPSTSNHRVEMPEASWPVPVESGVYFHDIPHRGNTQASDEEVAAIVKILAVLLGRPLTDSQGNTRPIALNDILFVAPYNLQVRRLEMALPAGARVGSVDRFQGQEAPIVILSLCSSADEFGARGLEFILDRNRLNVAISRAQALAIVVGDPGIASTLPNSIKELGLLNTFHKIESNRYYR